jgi:CheY-like chemotaxis protein/GAF domain-containing protein
LAERSRILILDGPEHPAERLSHHPGEWEAVRADDLPRLIALLEDGPFAACLIDPNIAGLQDQIRRYGQAAQILEMLDIGIAILDADWSIVWANRTFRGRCDGPAVGRNFLDALGNPTIKEGDLHPFDTAASGLSARFRLYTTTNRYIESHLSPLTGPDDGPRRYVLQCRDITPRVTQRQKLDALHAAGSSLAGLDPEQLQEMPVNQRIDLLKYNLKQSIHDVLKYQVIEIRMLDRRTNKLEPLLAEGMLPEAESRVLYASAEGNGVTGLVAATAQSYLCRDTSTDPYYIKGSAGARSSMTVPLRIQDQVIGTFNVESPEPNAFGPDELQFAELFAREIARALYTLELLSAQQLCSAQASLTAVNREIALPVDNILTTASRMLGNYLGLPEDVKCGLKRVLEQARQIKANIQKVGENIGPTRQIGGVIDGLSPTRLRGRRVLVVDSSEEFRQAAHQVLEQLGCIVETAGTAGEALTLAPVSSYDAVILDVKPPDMKGSEAFLKLREAHPTARMIMMAEFGYDGDHTLVKCRQAGLKFVLFKPFLVNQLVNALEGPEPGPVRTPTAEAVSIS